MNFDYGYSKDMRERFNHNYSYCYKNSFDLIKNKLVDSIAIGYVIAEGSNSAFRHSWCIKDNKIIDSTLVYDEKLRNRYVEIFRVNFTEAIKYGYEEDLALQQYDREKENIIISALEEEGLFVFSWIPSIQDKRIVRKRLKKKQNIIKSQKA